MGLCSVPERYISVRNAPCAPTKLSDRPARAAPTHRRRGVRQDPYQREDDLRRPRMLYKKVRCGLTTSAAVILPRVICMPVDSKQRLTKTPFIRPRHADVPATSLIHDGISGHPSPAKYGTQLVGAPARCSIFFFYSFNKQATCPPPRTARSSSLRTARCSVKMPWCA